MKLLIPLPLSGPLISKDVPYLQNGSLVPAQHGDYMIHYEVVDTSSTQWSTDIKGRHFTCGMTVLCQTSMVTTR